MATTSNPEADCVTLAECELQFVGGGSRKFYRGVVGQDRQTGEYVGWVRWGRIGAHGQAQEKYRGNVAQMATKAVNAMLDQKLAKGYQPRVAGIDRIGNVTAPAAAPAAAAGQAAAPKAKAAPRQKAAAQASAQPQPQRYTMRELMRGS